VNSTGRIELVLGAARLRVPYHTAHRWVLTGALKGERVAGRWYVDAADLQRLVADRRQRPDAGPAPQNPRRRGAV